MNLSEQFAPVILTVIHVLELIGVLVIVAGAAIMLALFARRLVRRDDYLDAFRALTSIQGVGGRLALAILSALAPDELARAAAQGDKAMIARANGVGPKLAQRIANELQGNRQLALQLSLIHI